MDNNNYEYNDIPNTEIQTVKQVFREGFEANDDFTLPDYISDIRKLVRTDTRTVIHNTFQNGQNIQCEGEVIYSLLLICDDDSVRNIIYSSDFNVSGNSGDYDVSELIHHVKAENAAARLTSPRKINCKSRITVSADVCVSKSLTPEYSGDHVLEDEMTLEKKNAVIDAINIDNITEKNLHASQDIDISSGLPEIANIVYCNIETDINEIKRIDNKLALRGQCTVSILYETTGGDYQRFTKETAFSEFVDAENISPECSCLCDVKINDVKAAVQNNSFGEMRMIELDYTYDLLIRIFSNNRVCAVKDIYSTEFEIDTHMQEINVCRLSEVFSSALSIGDNIEITEISDSDITEVTDVYAKIISCEIRNNDADNKLIISGDTQWELICKNADTDKEKYSHISLTIPYRYERESSCTTKDFMDEHTVKIISTSASIDKGKLILTGEMFINCMIADNKTENCVSGVKFLDRALEGSLPPITIYYPKQTEELWDIAKKYKCTCSDIMSANSLDSENLENVKVILLPKKKQKSLFNKVI